MIGSVSACQSRAARSVVVPRNSRAAALRSRGSVIAHGFSPKSPSSTANEAEDPKERQEMKAKLKAKENAIDGKDEKGNPIVEAAKEVVGAGEGKKPKSPNSTASEADDPGPRKAMKDALIDMQDKMDGKK